jgi:CO dehydrogenase/acetyl-CoA synthase epsilon subunit
MAKKLDCQVAATGNTIKEMEKHQGIKVKKAWLGELIASLKGEWEDPILPQRPDILIFIGYRPEMIDGMIAGMEQIDTVHLGPGNSLTAGCCVEETGLSQWKRYLEELIEAI